MDVMLLVWLYVYNFECLAYVIWLRVLISLYSYIREYPLRFAAKVVDLLEDLSQRLWEFPEAHGLG